MSRSLIFLFDGTGNDPTDASESQPTNVFNLNTLIAESRMERRRPRSQVTFYLPGIGTQFYVRGGMLDRTKQVLFGVGLDEMVMRAYVNLACNYRGGDDVVIIGFSRGAVAARIFARLITDFGLLKQRYVRFFTELFDTFDRASKATRDEYLHLSSNYREVMKIQLVENPVNVKFLGLFDCVIGPFDFNYKNFLSKIDNVQSSKIDSYVHLMSMHEVRPYFPVARLTPTTSRDREIWMPGVHSDVGGGYEQDLIARVSLMTMAQFLRVYAGIALNHIAVDDLGDMIKVLARSDKIYINLETDRPVSKECRKPLPPQQDKVHFIHKWLIGRPVHWKNEGETIYENRIGKYSICPLTKKFTGAYF